MSSESIDSAANWSMRPLSKHGNESSGSPVDSLAATSSIRVRLVRTAQQMARVVEFRRKAYARFESQEALMSKVEDSDLDRSAVVVCAEDLRNGALLGTMRVHCGSEFVARRFPDLELTTEFSAQRLSFVTRLAVSAPDTKLHAYVRSLLFKTCYQVCVAAQATEMLVVVHPRRTWQFQQLSFRNLSDGKTPVRLAALGYEPLIAMAAHVPSIGRILKEVNRPLHEFIFTVFHSEIEVFQSISSIASRGDSVDFGVAGMQIPRGGSTEETLTTTV